MSKWTAGSSAAASRCPTSSPPCGSSTTPSNQSRALSSRAIRLLLVAGPAAEDDGGDLVREVGALLPLGAEHGWQARGVNGKAEVVLTRPMIPPGVR